MSFFVRDQAFAFTYMLPIPWRMEVVPAASLAIRKHSLSPSRMGEARAQAALDTYGDRLAIAEDGLETIIPFARVYLRTSLAVGVSLEV